MAVDNGWFRSVGWMYMFESLAESTLTRKQFLLVIVSFVVGVVGLKHILQQTKTSSSSVISGFSNGPYGR